MTDEELDELERLTDAAFLGPWSRMDTGTQVGIISGTPPKTRGYLCKGDKARRVCYMNKSVEDNYVNLDFIVAARSAIPALIAEIRRLRGTRP